MRVLFTLISAAFLVACGKSLSPEAAVEEARSLLAQGRAGEARIVLKNALADVKDLAEARELLVSIALDEGNPQAAVDELAGLGPDADSPLTSILKARVALALGRPEEAVAALERAGPGILEPEGTVLRARADWIRGDSAAALRLLRPFQQQFPDNEEIVVEIAAALAVMGRADAAEDELDRYLAGDASARAEALRARGSLRLGDGRAAEAVEDLRAALEASPPDWPRASRQACELQIGDALLAAGRAEEARAQLDRIERLWPGLFGSTVLRARLALLEGRPTQAVDMLTGLTGGVPEDASLQYLLIDALARSGSLTRAVALLEKRIAVESEASQARRMLATLWMQRGRPDQVIDLLGAEAAEAQVDADQLLTAARGMLSRAGQAIVVLSAQMQEASKEEITHLRPELAAAYLANGQPHEALKSLGPVTSGEWSQKGMGVRMDALLTLGDEIQGTLLADQLIKDAQASDIPVLLAAADAAQRKQFTAIASRLLDRATALDSAHVDTRLRRASFALDQGNHAEAERQLGEVLKMQPKNTEALIGMARAQEMSGRLDEARRSLVAAIASESTSPDARMALARLELRVGRSAEAERVLAQLVELVPDGTGANSAGLLMAQFRQLDGAERKFKQAVAQAPDNSMYWFNLARAQLTLSKHAEARQSFVRSATLQPRSLPAVVAAVHLSLEQKDFKVAREVARASIAALPASPAAHLVEGHSALAAGDAAAALDAFGRSALLEPSAAASVGEFHARRALGRRPETPLLSWLAREPRDGAVRRILIDLYLQRGDRSDAREQLEILVGQEPNDAVALNNLAWLLRDSDRSRAEGLALQALAIEPENPALADTLGVIYLQAGKAVEAEALFASAALKLPRDPGALYHHARALHALGKTDAARQALGRALESDMKFDERDAARDLMKELR